MYAQCPACLTTFKVTPAQLAAHGGVVRCGICSAVFHADQRRLQTPPKAPPEAAAAEVPAKKHKNKRTGKSRRAAHRRHSDRAGAKTVPLSEDADIPTVTELRALAKPRFSWRPVFWGLGNVLLLALLCGQFLFFYRDDLAKQPTWRPAVEEFCRYAGCTLLPLQDVARIDLLQTAIAPHPKYENALRIRTTLVNRAPFPQDYPWMEISLTNNAGNVIARRTFTPAQYLETPAPGILTPNVVATTLLDVTNPDRRAVGYEIRLVTPETPARAVDENPVLLHALNALKQVTDETIALLHKVVLVFR
jgi:predicted Zn finger-like uncharacterized protein